MELVKLFMEHKKRKKTMLLMKTKDVFLVQEIMSVEHLWFSSKLQGQQEARKDHKTEEECAPPSTNTHQDSGGDGAGKKSLK